MDLKQLSYFLDVCETQSFSRAAMRLRLTQSALSRRIRDLELELGVSLLKRHGRGVSLTEAGTLLRDRATGLLRLADAVKNEVVARAREPTGDLVVALPGAFRNMITSSLVARFNADYPLVRIRILELTSPGRQEAVLSGTADLAVNISVEPEDGLVLQPLVNESLFLIGKAVDPTTTTSSAIPVSRIKGLPLVQTAWPNGLRLILEKALAREEVTSDTRIEADTLAVMIDLVLTGRYYTVLPYSCIEAEVLAGSVSAAPLQRTALTWQVVSAKGRPISPAARVFEERLRERCQELISTGRWKTGKLLSADAPPQK